MKKVLFAGLTAIVFSCAIGIASAYTYNSNEAKKVTAACSCGDCSCQHCSCTDCSTGSCTAGCCK